MDAIRTAAVDAGVDGHADHVDTAGAGAADRNSDRPGGGDGRRACHHDRVDGLLADRIEREEAGRTNARVGEVGLDVAANRIAGIGNADRSPNACQTTCCSRCRRGQHQRVDGRLALGIDVDVADDSRQGAQAAQVGKRTYFREHDIFRKRAGAAEGRATQPPRTGGQRCRRRDGVDRVAMHREPRAVARKRERKRLAIRRDKRPPLALGDRSQT